MGKRGPKTTPTVLKLVKGNPGKRPLNRHEPEAPPIDKIPAPPAYFGPHARDFWNEVAPVLQRMRVLTEVDMRAFEILSATYEEWHLAKEEVRAKGLTIDNVTEFGVVTRANPAVAMVADAARRMRSYLGEFGVTPSSRSAIKLGPGKVADPLSEFLSGGPKRA